jgi:hypothetical protein
MRKILTLALATLLTTSAFAVGEVYRWKDATGNWHYSDQPQPGAELVRSARRATAGSPAAAPPVASPAPTPLPMGAPPVSREVAQQVRQEASAAKADQCKKAEDAYQKTIQARRIYKTDEKGNRTFLNDAEIDTARLEARNNKDLACGP